MRNLLTNALPETVEVDGSVFNIRTDFRIGIQVSLAIQDTELDELEKIEKVITLYYVDSFPSDLEKAINAVIDFHIRKELTQSEWSPKSLKKVVDDTLDFDYDSDNVCADFQREYGLDLTDPTLYIHWWRFLALLNGLSDTSLIKTIASYRAYQPDHDEPKETRKERLKIKRAFALPPKTYEEAVARQRAKWGD